MIQVVRVFSPGRNHRLLLDTVFNCTVSKVTVVRIDDVTQGIKIWQPFFSARVLDDRLIFKHHFHLFL
jgi:hypothetical protein